MRARGLNVTTGGLFAAALALPQAADAHGIGGRADLPIPAWLFAWAAALVLVASFAALATLWPRPLLEQAPRRRLLTLPSGLEPLAGAIGIAVFAFVVYAGLAGNQTATANLAPTFVFVIFWVGTPLLSALLGDVFAALNPWRAVGRGCGWAAARVARTTLPEPLAYPARLGRWPAAAGILAFAWLELVYAGRDDPSTLAILALVYAAVMLVGMSLFGERAWSANADPFGVAFGLIARLAPLEWRERSLYLQPPLSGAPAMPVVPGAAALVCTLIGTTSFDGFAQGGIWTGTDGLLQRLTDAWHGLGLSLEHAGEAAGSVGLLVMVALVSGLYRAGVAGMRTVGGDRSADELAGRFAHSLIPIALAYITAHYFSLLLFQGQAMGYLLSDPLGRDSDLFGTSSSSIDYGLISPSGIWYVQVAALTLGHVSGLALAHDRALTTWSRPSTATRSQYWMLLVMVAFTSLGLWLLSSSSR